MNIIKICLILSCAQNHFPAENFSWTQGDQLMQYENKTLFYINKKKEEESCLQQKHITHHILVLRTIFLSKKIQGRKIKLIRIHSSTPVQQIPNLFKF